MKKKKKKEDSTQLMELDWRAAMTDEYEAASALIPMFLSVSFSRSVNV